MNTQMLFYHLPISLVEVDLNSKFHDFHEGIIEMQLEFIFPRKNEER
jgi:hypothetical protein